MTRSTHIIQIAQAFRDRRAITRGTMICTGDLIQQGAWDLMWYDPRGSVWVQALSSRREIINDLAESLGLGRPLSLVEGELAFRGEPCRQCGSYELCGPLGALAMKYAA
jgi:hypothetical protein